MWQQIIRTGNVQQDQWMLEQARAHAAAQGLVLDVRPLPEGGLEVRALPPGAQGSPPSAAPLAPLAPLAPVAPAAMAAGGVAARRFVITLKKHTGMLVLMSTRTIRLQGTLEQCEAAYREAQNHNLLAGWWGFFSALFMNWIAIFSNMSAIGEVRRLAALPPGR